eukprot:CAMPEP_0204400428 /NCGR_PEP_ID=MMETSP0470-20130426/4083_1 /ASSEMBLY_ACC=CAM_ASM_000385 /TAXON_ID=2969 /ORGANISM="Oxyrrhis marina" /LENGTH=722 /DNA_ID=CAMNT_0051395299 /DNA_START=10 /DNA_END=2178 /DNA_ORIENTATION=+
MHSPFRTVDNVPLLTSETTYDPSVQRRVVQTLPTFAYTPPKNAQYRPVQIPSIVAAKAREPPPSALDLNPHAATLDYPPAPFATLPPTVVPPPERVPLVAESLGARVQAYHESLRREAQEVSPTRAVTTHEEVSLDLGSPVKHLEPFLFDDTFCADLSPKSPLKDHSAEPGTPVIGERDEGIMLCDSVRGIEVNPPSAPPPPVGWAGAASPIPLLRWTPNNKLALQVPAEEMVLAALGPAPVEVTAVVAMGRAQLGVALAGLTGSPVPPTLPEGVLVTIPQPAEPPARHVILAAAQGGTGRIDRVLPAAALPAALVIVVLRAPLAWDELEELDRLLPHFGPRSRVGFLLEGVPCLELQDSISRQPISWSEYFRRFLAQEPQRGGALLRRHAEISAVVHISESHRLWDLSGKMAPGVQPLVGTTWFRLFEEVAAALNEGKGTDAVGVAWQRTQEEMVAAAADDAVEAFAALAEHQRGPQVDSALTTTLETSRTDALCKLTSTCSECDPTIVEDGLRRVLGSMGKVERSAAAENDAATQHSQREAWAQVSPQTEVTHWRKIVAEHLAQQAGAEAAKLRAALEWILAQSDAWTPPELEAPPAPPSARWPEPLPREANEADQRAADLEEQLAQARNELAAAEVALSNAKRMQEARRQEQAAEADRVAQELAHRQQQAGQERDELEGELQQRIQQVAQLQEQLKAAQQESDAKKNVAPQPKACCAVM